MSSSRLHIILAFCGLFATLGASAQDDPTMTVGLRVRALIPSGFLNNGPSVIDDNGFVTTAEIKPGYAFGIDARWQYHRMLGLEFGLHYMQRNYGITFDLQDSSLTSKTDLGVVTYQIPLMQMVFIRLSEGLYMNVGLGISANMFASDVLVSTVEDRHEFTFTGRRVMWFKNGTKAKKTWINGGFDAQVGFEYRTKKKGAFYLGASYHLPMQPLMLSSTSYEYDLYNRQKAGKLKGSVLSVDLRYFFNPTPLNKEKTKRNRK